MTNTARAHLATTDQLDMSKLSKVQLFGMTYFTGSSVAFVQQLLRLLFSKRRASANRNRHSSSAEPKRLQLTVLPTSMNDIVGMHKHPELRKAVSQFSIRITDGVPLVWLARLKGVRPAGRLYGPDMMRLIIAEGRKYRLRHFFYGGTSKTLKLLSAQLAKQHSGYLMAGSYAPPFRDLSKREFNDVVLTINRTNPDVLWIGIGSWKQVIFAQQLRAKISVPLLLPVGAAFDFLSGTKHQAPRWVMWIGMEWLFRLCSEPGRLWKRYILQIPFFIVFSILELANYYRQNTTHSK